MKAQYFDAQGKAMEIGTKVAFRNGNAYFEGYVVRFGSYTCTVRPAPEYAAQVKGSLNIYGFISEVAYSMLSVI